MRSAARASLAALAIFVVARSAAVQTPQLLIDGNPAPGVSSNPTSWGRGPVDGTVNLVFDDGVHGIELWQSDGTAVGTVRLTNFSGAVIFRFVTTMADLTVFVVERGNLLELWRTDGTPSGTTLLHTGSVSSGLGYPTHQVAHGTVMFFNDNYMLWRTDGTVAGTFSLGVPWAGWKAALPGATLLYGHQSQELIVSDGNTAAVVGVVPGNLIVTPDWGMFQATWQLTLPFTTTLTALHLPGSAPLVLPLLTGILQLRDRALLLATPSGLQRWDGTGPPQQLQAWTALANYYVPWGTKWVFAATMPGAGSELVVSDGTVAGTQVLDVVPGAAGSNAQIAVALRDRLVFWATTSAAGSEPHATDATLAATVQLGDLEPGPAGSQFAGFTLLGERRAVLAIQTTALGKEPWLTDGTVAGTTLLADIRPGPASSLITPGGFLGNIGMLAGDALLFPADDGVHGREFWVLPVPGSRTVLQRYSTRRFDAGDPVLGTSVAMRASALQPGELGVVAIGSPLATFVPIAPRRCVHLDPWNAVVVATIAGSSNGTWNGTVALPNLPVAVGLDLVVQALFVDAAMPLGVDVGDATWWALGS
jgi:ELWxxDGT repeat protein